MIEYFKFSFAKIYAYLYIFLKNFFGVQVAGLGFFLRLCKEPRLIHFNGEMLYFEPRVASSYGLHVIGRQHEPESHLFLNKVFDQIGLVNAYFIEVGANIGIFMLDESRQPSVKVIGFEPSSDCVSAIQTTMNLNGRSNFQIFNYLVGDKNCYIPYDSRLDPQGASVHNSSKSHLQVRQVSLDNFNLGFNLVNNAPVVLMVDVEGYEINVLSGATLFIRKKQPRTLFEYNFFIKKYFHICKIQELIGNEYDIFRLSSDGYLDTRVSDAWNCVAVPRKSQFIEFVRGQICVE